VESGEVQQYFQQECSPFHSQGKLRILKRSLNFLMEDKSNHRGAFFWKSVAGQPLRGCRSRPGGVVYCMPGKSVLLYQLYDAEFKKISATLFQPSAFSPTL